MPKNEKGKKKDANVENGGVEASAASTPTGVYFPPSEGRIADATATPVGPVTSRAPRRLGTGAIIAISAAGVALLAGVFTGGLAVGVAVANHGGFGMNHQMRQVGGQLHNGNRQGGSF